MLRLIVILRQIQDVLRIEAARRAVGLAELGLADFIFEYEETVESNRGPDLKLKGTPEHNPAKRTRTRIRRVSLLPKERKLKQFKRDGRRVNVMNAMESRQLGKEELKRRLELYRQRAEKEIDLFG